MRIDLGCIFWVLLLSLLFTGSVTLGSVLSTIFYIIAGFVLLALIGSYILRRRLIKMQQQAQEQGAHYRTYTWNFGGGRQSNHTNTHSSQTNPNEGRVSVESAPKPQKRINEDVGEYVDFEEN